MHFEGGTPPFETTPTPLKKILDLLWYVSLYSSECFYVVECRGRSLFCERQNTGQSG